MDMYVTGEPAGNWDTAVGNSALTNYEVDVTGIDDMDKLEQYMQEHAGAIPYEMVNGQKVYVRFAKLPQNNTAVTIQGITALVQGTAGYLTGYTGEGFWMKLGKSALLNAIVQSMYVAIDANAVAQSFIGDLDSVLDDFCIVGTNDVPVYVDSNGVSYVIEDAVEAVRMKMIELGVYSPAEEEVPSGPSSYNTYFDFPFSVQPSGKYTGKRSSSAYFWETTDAEKCVFFWTGSGTKYLTWIATSSIGPFHYSSDYETLYPGTVRLSDGSYTKDGKTVYFIFLSTGAINVFNDSYVSLKTRMDGMSAPLYKELAWLIQYASVGGQVIEGMTVVDSIPMGFGDATLPLGDVVPGWALRGKDVSMPDEDNIWAKNPVLPLDVPLDDVWADGYAGDSADTYDGDLADLLKDALVDVLPDILDDIITDTVITPDDMYKIPVDDGGDSPTPLPPVLEGTGNGLWGIYNPELSEVNEFGSWLWSSNILDQITRMFASPIDAVIAFHVIYCTPQVGAKENIMCGFLDSGVDAYAITSQYVDIPCGTIAIPEYYGTALDYDYTKIALYLPFIGFVNLSANVCMGSNISVLYRVDVLTGTCLAQVSVIKPNTNAVMYTFVGNCAVQLPLTATTYTGTVGALMGLATSFVGSEIGSFSMFTRGIAQVGQSIGESLGTGGVRQSGAISSNAGALGPRKPYLIVTRPVAYDAFEYNHQYGYPVNKTIALNSVTGYTKVKSIHLAGIPCTDDELELIENLLKEGVIFN